MSHRLFGPVAGITALTGLALTLACGGGGSQEEAPNVQPGPITIMVGGEKVTSVYNGYDLHRYTITASADHATSYEATDKDGNKLESTSTSATASWYYKPQYDLKVGIEQDTITITAKNREGAPSKEPGVFTMVISPNAEPDNPFTTAIKVSPDVPVVKDSLPLTCEIAGDTITWNVLEGKSAFSIAGGVASASGKYLLINADKFVSSQLNENYGLVLESTQKQGDWVVNTKEHTVLVFVSDDSEGSLPTEKAQPEITTPAPTGDNRVVYAGIPWIYRFEARDKANPGNQVNEWVANKGGTDSKSKDPQPWSWTTGTDNNKPVPQKLADPNVPDSYELFRGHRGNLSFSKGDVIYIAPNTANANLPFGVAAYFKDTDGELANPAFLPFTLDVKANTAPTIEHAEPDPDHPGNPKPVIATSIKGGYWGNPEADALVLKGSSEGSLDLSSVITFTSTITDPDFDKGDIITVGLKGIHVGSSTKNLNEDNGYFTADNLAINLNGSSLYNSGASKWDKNYTKDSLTSTFTLNGSISLVNPKSGDIEGLTGGENLRFVFTVQDLINDAKEITVTVPTKSNSVVLNAGASGNGDLVGTSSWDIPRVPTEGEDTIWKMGWAEASAQYKIFSANKLPVYLRVIPTPDLDERKEETGIETEDISESVTIENAMPLAYSTTEPLKLSWTPDHDQTRKPYSFTLEAFTEWGAAASMEMKGISTGNISGLPIEKVIYRNRIDNPEGAPARTTDTDSRPANLFTWASIKVNPFYNSGEKANTYSSEGEPVTYTPLPDNEDGFGWRAYRVPKGFYLVSADKSPESDQTTTLSTPVIGPAVTDTAGATVAAGSSNWGASGGNLMAFAYISSSSPDLTTFAGSGKYAEKVDGSLNATGANGYDFELDSLSLLGSANYQGKTIGIGADKLDIQADVIQFVYPTIGMKGFFTPNTATPNKKVYPADKYNLIGWYDGELGKATNVPSLSTDEKDYDDIQFNFFGALPWQMTEDDPVTAATMVLDEKLKAYYLVRGTSQEKVFFEYPYWKMASTGNAKDDAELDENFLPLPQTIKFTPIGETDKHDTDFDGTIDRQSFRDALNTLITFNKADNKADTTALLASLTENLQVLAYVNGTELGPVENHHGVPTYMEFGNINAEMQNLVKSDAEKRYGGTLELGPVPIPKPPTNWSAGQSTPVASYIVKYSSPAASYDAGSTGLPGSMGVITDKVGDAIRLTVPPVTDVKITTGATSTEPVSNYYVGNTLTRPGAFGPDSTAATKSATARASTVGGNNKIKLSWTNPKIDGEPVEFSGNILEFFSVPYATGVLNDGHVPKYKVYVSPETNEFPIPNEWVTSLATDDMDRVVFTVVRIRTVKYGEGGNFINFDVEPFKQALPAVWSETITSKINFGSASQDLVKDEWTKDTVVKFYPSTTKISVIDTILGGNARLFAETPIISHGTKALDSAINFDWAKALPDGIGLVTDATKLNPVIKIADASKLSDGTVSVDVKAKVGSIEVDTPTTITTDIIDLASGDPLTLYVGSTALESPVTVEIPINPGWGAKAEIVDIFGAAGVSIGTTKATSKLTYEHFKNTNPSDYGKLYVEGYEVKWDTLDPDLTGKADAKFVGASVDNLMPQLTITDGNELTPDKDNVTMKLNLIKKGPSLVTLTVPVTVEFVAPGATWYKDWSWIEWGAQSPYFAVQTISLPAMAVSRSANVFPTGHRLTVTANEGESSKFVPDLSRINYGTWKVWDSSESTEITSNITLTSSSTYNTLEAPVSITSGMKLTLPTVGSANYQPDVISGSIFIKSGDVKYDGVAGNVAKPVKIEVQMKDIVDGNPVTWTNNASLKIGTNGEPLSAGTLTSFDSPGDENVIKIGLAGWTRGATQQIFPTISKIAAAEPSFEWASMPNSFYELVWTVTAVTNTFYDPAGMQGVLSCATTDNVTKSFTPPTINFLTGAPAWEAGNSFEVKVELRSPFGSRPASKPVVFRVEFVD
ncbi:MAG: hypothetical protein FWG12_06890 [Holophagaceae bacterium]|nr:hypothetical protein [Holophagaceae bacterium]